MCPRVQRLGDGGIRLDRHREEGAEEGANDLVVMMVTMMTKITMWSMMIHMVMRTVGVTMCKYNAQFGLHRSDNCRRAANRGHGLEKQTNYVIFIYARGVLYHS
jgi:hypothetical protein